MKHSTVRAALLGACIAAACVVTAPGAALAAPAQAPQIAAPSAPSVDHVDIPDSVAVADDYWTAERMRNAIPAETLAADDVAKTKASDVAKGAPVVLGTPSAEASKAAPKDGMLRPSATRETPIRNIGKVFFTLGGANYVCSANSVSSSNGSVVSTAGHCVNEGGGAYATRWIFVPGYENGNAPYGQWAATGFASPTQWTRNGDISYDVAFVKVGTLNGRTLAQTVGATPVAFNQARGLTYKAYGYPAASPFNGETLQSCSGRATADPFGQSQSQGIPCDMTGGSSGGPWFLSSGAQNSVNSFGYTSVRNTMFGPYYGSVAQSAYTSASNG